MSGKNNKNIKYKCSNCGAETLKWMGRCPQCGEWNTLEEKIEVSAPKNIRISGAETISKAPVSLSKINLSNHNRIKLGLSEVDRPLGGGVVPGSVILWGGEPGIGKSTLILQICNAMAKTGNTVLYCSGEESEEQIKLRAERLNINEDACYIYSGGDLEAIINEANEIKPNMLVIDSIQTMYISDNDSPMGSPAQIRDCTAALVRFAKANNITVMIIGHVTKEGNLAGPRILEHMVDVVLYLEGDRSYQFRVLRTVKNRFGSTADSGLFVMEGKGLIGIQDPSTYLLRDRAEMVPGSIVMACMEGLRPILIEIQALTTHSVLAIPRRISSGYDYNRLVILLAVLEKRGHVMFSSDDVYLNVAGGFKVRETAADLAVALALVSMKKEKPIPAGLMALGEIGLTGEILPVSHIGIRLKEGIKMNFKQFILPSRNKNEVLSLEKSGKIGHGLDIHFVEKITQALDFL